MIEGEVQAPRRAQLPQLGSRCATTWGSLNMLGGEPRCFSALRCFVAFSLHRRPFLWAGLARLGRRPPLLAATTVPRLMASPLPSTTCVNSSIQAAAILSRTWTLEGA